MTDQVSDPEVIMDFDNGVDSIEFLIQSFGYDEIDVLQQNDVENATVEQTNGKFRLVGVDATELNTDSFSFGSNEIPGVRLTSDQNV